MAYSCVISAWFFSKNLQLSTGKTLYSETLGIQAGGVLKVLNVKRFLNSSQHIDSSRWIGLTVKLAVLAKPALVGKERLEALQSFLASAIEGKGKTVFISGEAGAGKTRLVTEFLKSAKKRDVAVLAGWCLSNATVPISPSSKRSTPTSLGNLPKEPNSQQTLQDG